MQLLGRLHQPFALWLQIFLHLRILQHSVATLALCLLMQLFNAVIASKHGLLYLVLLVLLMLLQVMFMNTAGNAHHEVILLRGGTF